MQEQAGKADVRFQIALMITGVLAIALLYMSSVYNYLLFHAAAEMFSVVIACGVFVIAWNARNFMRNDYFLFIGIASLFVAFLDFVHTLSYKGMPIFMGYGTDLSIQLWVAARYMQAISLLVAPVFFRIRARPAMILPAYAFATVFLLAAIFAGVFPAAYVEGAGLTQFKILSEYLIVIILVAAAFSMYRIRDMFDREVLIFLMASIGFMILSELTFTEYVSVYDFANFAGHIFKVIEFCLIYLAVIRIGLSRPYSLLFRELNEEKSRVEELSKMRDIFTRDISHELMTPLTIILGNIYILRKLVPRDRKGERMGALDMLEKNSMRLRGSINEILQLSKLDTLKPDFERVEVMEVLDDALDEHAQLAKMKGIYLRLDAKPSTMVADRQLITLAVNNLLSNAIKFTGKGGVVVRSRPAKDSVSISVSDTGIGISEEDRKKLFTKFFKADADAAGTGIGLIIVKGIVEKHGGTVRVESAPGKGSTFEIVLPLAHGDGK